MPAQQEDVRHGRKARLTSNDSGLLEAAQRFWQKSYAGDYLGLILLTGAYMLLRMFGEPFHQMFTLDDVRLQHPHADIERVGVCMLNTHTYQLIHPKPKAYTKVSANIYPRNRSLPLHLRRRRPHNLPPPLHTPLLPRHPQSPRLHPRLRNQHPPHRLPHRRLQKRHRSSPTGLDRALQTSALNAEA